MSATASATRVPFPARTASPPTARTTTSSIAILNNVNPAGTTPGYPGLLELTPAALQAIGG